MKFFVLGKTKSPVILFLPDLLLPDLLVLEQEYGWVQSSLLQPITSCCT